jgi:hypothetical protein
LALAIATTGGDMHELYRILGSEREADLHADAAKLHGTAKTSPLRARRRRGGLANATAAFLTRLRRTSVGYEAEAEVK